MRKAEDRTTGLRGAYPPESLLTLLGIYLLPGLPTVTKKSFVAYFLLDLLDATENEMNDIVSAELIP